MTSWRTRATLACPWLDVKSVLRQLCVTIRLNDLPGACREGSVDLDRDLLERAVAGRPTWLGGAVPLDAGAQARPPWRGLAEGVAVPGKALVHELASAIEFAALTSQLCSEERQLWSAEGGMPGYLVKPVVGVIVGQPAQ